MSNSSLKRSLKGIHRVNPFLNPKDFRNHKQDQVILVGTCVMFTESNRVPTLFLFTLDAFLVKLILTRHLIC